MERHNLVHNGYSPFFTFIAIIILMLLLAGCGSYKPVADRNHWQPDTEYHQVSAGETLYAIAWKYGIDYREIARLNKITAPYKIKAKQRIRIRAANASSRVKTASVTAARRNSIHSNSVLTDQVITSRDLQTRSIKTWLWPVQGRIIEYYASQNGMNKGIDIEARSGTVVKATAAGRVVYSGSSLRGYGELIIIKHNEEFLSAYAHNKKLLVHEGEKVLPGQAIAQAGNTDAKRVLLHFEIRKAGKPVDPLKYLSQLH